MAWKPGTSKKWPPVMTAVLILLLPVGSVVIFFPFPLSPAEYGAEEVVGSIAEGVVDAFGLFGGDYVLHEGCEVDLTAAVEAGEVFEVVDVEVAVLLERQEATLGHVERVGYTVASGDEEDASAHFHGEDELFLHAGDAGEVEDGVVGCVGDLGRPAVALDVEGFLGGADLAGNVEAAVVDVADGDACALEGGELGGGLANAAGADDEDFLADLRGGIADGVEGDGCHAVDCGLAAVDIVGEFDEELVFGDDDVFDMGTGACADEDVVAGLEKLGIGAGLDDAADGLIAVRHGQEVVARGVVAPVELVAFGAVGDAGVEGLDFDLVGVGRVGIGPVGDEDFLSDVVGPVSEYDGSHG